MVSPYHLAGNVRFSIENSCIFCGDAHIPTHHSAAEGADHDARIGSWSPEMRDNASSPPQKQPGPTSLKDAATLGRTTGSPTSSWR
jgi:hypothetical protein